MRRYIACALVLTFGQCAFGQIGKDTDLWDWTKDGKHHDAVVKVQIEAANEGGAKASATGVIVRFKRISDLPRGEAYCLTAAHVLESAFQKTTPAAPSKEEPSQGKTAGTEKQLTLNKQTPAVLKQSALINVYYRSGEISRKCQLVALDEKRDVALLRVAVPSKQKVVLIASKPIKPGDVLEFAGLGGGSSVTKPRHFNALASAPTTADQIFADASLLPGDSGGAVFNEDGEVVGVISGGWIWMEHSGVRNGSQYIPATWPARACNVTPIRQLHLNRKAFRRSKRR